jgi:hypothetical protein
MKYDYINKENNVPKILLILDSFFSKFPSFNSIFGMCLYSVIIYLLLLFIRIYCRKPEYDEDDFDLFDKEDKDEIIEIKKRREKLLKDPEFIKKLEENRKKKAIEAMELLNKINK